MSTIGQKTGIGRYDSLEGKVRYGLRCCRRNNPISCGNCPYVFLKNNETKDITNCTTALISDAEEYIDQLRGNKLRFIDDLPAHVEKSSPTPTVIARNSENVLYESTDDDGSQIFRMICPHCEETWWSNHGTDEKCPHCGKQMTYIQKVTMIERSNIKNGR